MTKKLRVVGVTDVSGLSTKEVCRRIAEGLSTGNISEWEIAYYLGTLCLRDNWRIEGETYDVFVKHVIDNDDTGRLAQFLKWNKLSDMMATYACWSKYDREDFAETIKVIGMDTACIPIAYMRNADEEQADYILHTLCVSTKKKQLRRAVKEYVGSTTPA